LTKLTVCKKEFVILLNWLYSVRLYVKIKRINMHQSTTTLNTNSQK